MCLIDALEVPQIQISTSCRTKLTERRQLWNVAHNQYKILLPESWKDIYQIVNTHPRRDFILTFLFVLTVFLLLVGCLCERFSKRKYSELKKH